MRQGALGQDNAPGRTRARQGVDEEMIASSVKHPSAMQRAKNFPRLKPKLNGHFSLGSLAADLENLFYQCVNWRARRDSNSDPQIRSLDVEIGLAGRHPGIRAGSCQ
jgi:hypothetical protein